MSGLGMPSLPCSQQLQPRSGGALWGAPRERRDGAQWTGQWAITLFLHRPLPSLDPVRPPSRHQLTAHPDQGHADRRQEGAGERCLEGLGVRRSAGDILDSPATPSWTLPYPASIYLPMEWAPEGSSGDRGTGQKLEQDAWPPWACVCSRWPPVGGPYQCCPWPWLPAPGLPTRAPGSRWNCAPAWEDAGRPG